MSENTVTSADTVDAAAGTPRHIIIMGVSGSGKTTVAKKLAADLGYVYGEGDDMHSQANRDKMNAGTPLTDEDRWPWLRTIARWMSDHAAQGQSTVVTCSALKRVYRDVLASADGDTVFAHLCPDPELIADRMAKRSGHFMPASLLDTQLETLEPLHDDEPGFTVTCAGTPDEVRAELTERLEADGRHAS